MENKKVKIEDYYFDVKERPIYYESDTDLVECKSYKGIYNAAGDRLISVVNNTYQLVKNEDIIKPILDELSSFDSRWYIDQSHSFVHDNKMRLQLTFPDLTFKDNESNNALSLYLHNSYDGSEGVKMTWGFMRQICTNGAVVLEVLKKFYAKHSKNNKFFKINDLIRESYDKIPEIQARIEVMQNISANEEKLLKNIDTHLGKKIMEEATPQINDISMWQLYNILTYYVSHNVEMQQRAKYQQNISRIFQL